MPPTWMRMPRMISTGSMPMERISARICALRGRSMGRFASLAAPLMLGPSSWWDPGHAERWSWRDVGDAGRWSCWDAADLDAGGECHDGFLGDGNAGGAADFAAG